MLHWGFNSHRILLLIKSAQSSQELKSSWNHQSVRKLSLPIGPGGRADWSEKVACDSRASFGWICDQASLSRQLEASQEVRECSRGDARRGTSSQSRATRPKLIRKVQKLSPKPRLSEGVHRSEKHVCGCLCDQAGFYDYLVLCGSCKSSQDVQKCLKSYLLPIGRIEEWYFRNPQNVPECSCDWAGSSRVHSVRLTIVKVQNFSPIAETRDSWLLCFGENISDRMKNLENCADGKNKIIISKNDSAMKSKRERLLRWLFGVVWQS